MFSKKKRRTNEGINAGSMADIAFLLLIFFLVTTTILSDEGLMVKLPPYQEEAPPTDVLSRNLYSVKINGDNQLLVKGELMRIAELKAATKNFIMNPLGLSNMAASPKKALISLQCDRSTNYTHYLNTYNELKAAYREMRADWSIKQYGVSYEFLATPLQKKVRNAIPIVISEAESFDANGLLSQ